ncbi:MAG: metal-dependent hydrolase [Nocardiaceae bacterium]|nr:metal-dependent hydrolase [Nocardiaceae bacterium]
MVMGPTHAMSGAAAGLAVAAVLPPAAGGPSSVAETFIWAGVCAGAALLPDIDLPQSTIARTFGPISHVAAHGINKASAMFYNVTASGRDGHRSNGHRTLTHTVLFAFGLGIVISSLVTAFAKPAIIATLFVTLGLAIRGLAGDWARKHGPIMTTAVTGLLSTLAWTSIPPATGSTSLGLAITTGCLVHYLGDAITKDGVPLLAPLVPINGRRWHAINPPALVCIRANGLVEKIAILPALTLTTVALAAAALPTTHTG